LNRRIRRNAATGHLGQADYKLGAACRISSGTPVGDAPEATFGRLKARAQVEEIRSARVRNFTDRTSNWRCEPEMASDYQKTC
jgi:hypothetical protein